MDPVVAAIDPGTRRVGYCIVNGAGRAIELGVIAPKSRGLPERLREIQDGLDRLFARFRPSEVAVETPYVGRNAAAALTLAGGRALAMVSAARIGAKVFEYTAPEAKRSVTGTGAAGKTSVRRMVQLLLGLTAPPPEDAADAAALAICHQGRRR
ncbi:MAG TPA: crossover junction endodeoxyribonuclease RuvC [Planctomycetota bacterium]|nr:crossover junction endodeoxyribonuclease RuvC [Planctomycetota bacterium]